MSQYATSLNSSCNLIDPMAQVDALNLNYPPYFDMGTGNATGATYSPGGLQRFAPQPTRPWQHDQFAAANVDMRDFTSRSVSPGSPSTFSSALSSQLSNGYGYGSDQNDTVYHGASATNLSTSYTGLSTSLSQYPNNSHTQHSNNSHAQYLDRSQQSTNAGSRLPQAPSHNSDQLYWLDKRYGDMGRNCDAMDLFTAIPDETSTYGQYRGSTVSLQNPTYPYSGYHHKGSASDINVYNTTSVKKKGNIFRSIGRSLFGGGKGKAEHTQKNIFSRYVPDELYHNVATVRHVPVPPGFF